MFLYQYGKRVFKPLLFLFAGMLLSLSIILSYSITVYAEEPSAPTSATISLTHTHRGDSSTEGGCYTIPVLHQHSGDESSGGPCYSPIYHSHGSSCYGTCSYHPISVTLSATHPSYCAHHGEVEEVSYTVRISHSNCGRGLEYRDVNPGCPKCGGSPEAGCTGTHSYLRCTQAGTIVGYSRTCGRTEGETIDYYDPGCGLEVRSYGDITLNNSTPEWTTGNVTLTGALNDPEGVISDGGFGSMSFRAESGEIVDTGSDNVTVSENGVYVMDITVDDARFDTASASVMLVVSNIDRTSPEITSVTYDQGDTWLHVNEITVTAIDLQPDGSAGSGLADEAYSFDGGNTWQSSPTYPCTANGAVDICVRDYCGNVSPITTVEITNVDNAGPDVSYIFTPTIWYPGDAPRQYTFTATDEESGLPEFPFSYDGGETWTDEIRLTAGSEGTITVLVRDNLDNITELTIINKHSERPNHDDDDDNEEDNSDDSPGDNDGNGQDNNNNAPKKKDVDENTDDNSEESDASHGNSNGNAAGNASEENAGGDSSDNYLNDSNSGSGSGESSVYFEQLPTSSAGDGLPGGDTLKEHTPFYRTKVFKAVASVGGGFLAASALLGLFVMLYSGVIIYTYDGDKYRLTGLRLIRRSERGNYIFLSGEFIENAYSSRYKMKLGPVYVKRHADDLLSINADGDWTAVNVERLIYMIL